MVGIAKDKEPSVMKQTWVVLSTLTVILVLLAFWGSRPSAAAATASVAPTAPATSSEDPFQSAAAYRHRNCQPNHWRAYVLQR